ncbi:MULTISPECIES: GNAT family N-acetyltransferase [Flavobacterium]|jgi:ribosomal protein S18 acetylase RimI-like enzyme|uniref:Acetyltransferase (GNAT) family protein n=1 Tax=Flavobacterium anhuiense TaxID=459526 RepID=A0AAC9GHN9_9FLAO|nr:MULTISPECIES: GNAT family N-acetyltransferase [Flavobacterium]AOC94675.1 Acetyltransferase (GNAT) family protein [Flavobacterium anhuiense]EJG01002.1 N-acetyltransferase GCN5 [Flavobacterium sp. F52]URM37913.1 GNAT family N-acetyltransferase [Flavobacterium anhuiense]SCX94409.1 Ribosomal protein S18 acetylase RimI [Flavobacterium anhuiense]
MALQIKELTTIDEMAAQINTIRFLYPNISLEKYKSFLSEMLPHNYIQIAVFEDDICLGLTGCWSATKLWTGKYLEIDNFVVNPEYRSKGIGKMLTDYVDKKAIELNCSSIVLDAFTGNFGAHRFYYNQGYAPRGFHFVKILDEKKLTV